MKRLTFWSGFTTTLMRRFEEKKPKFSMHDNTMRPGIRALLTTLYYRMNRW
jgi:hypothetical protein